MSEEVDCVEKLRSMELHEYWEDKNWGITRVNGGWIYLQLQTLNCVFVPLSYEFSNRRIFEH